ncbi:MAG: hypothetical protein BM485_08205 [Desulfobulbaceae bacterium DB1]|nr:MAG: hypothetical protein BM485_08205 [Desulfobulbaceae bacterium DB1]
MKEREIKKRLQRLLKEKDLEYILRELRAVAPRNLVASLLSSLYQTDERIKWNAVTVIGEIMNDIARVDMEAARVVMRRILWSLNEESGGIGWGMPEAMGEIMAVNGRLAGEYAHLLVSYMREENYLELPALQHGLLWGIGRLAMVRPELLLKNDADGHMVMYLESADQVAAGLACRNFGLLHVQEAAYQIRHFLDSPHVLALYEDRRLFSTTVGALARQALQRLGVCA